jgi:hypothetical protein
MTNPTDPPRLTRFTTPEEKSNIAGISLDDTDVSHFMDQLHKGLITAAAMADGAVQDDMALSVEATVRVSRPVRDGEDIVDLVGREVVDGRVKARKVYVDPEKAPKVD